MRSGLPDGSSSCIIIIIITTTPFNVKGREVGVPRFMMVIRYGILLIYDVMVYGMVHHWYMVWWYMVCYIVGVYGMIHCWYMVWYSGGSKEGRPPPLSPDGGPIFLYFFLIKTKTMSFWS